MSIIHRYKHRLLLVDIQKSYSHFYNFNYLLKVKRFLSKHSFEDITLLIDIFEDSYLGEFIPTFIDQSLSIQPIFKQYCSDLAHRLLNEEGLDSTEIKLELLKHNCTMPFHDGLLVLLEPSHIPNYQCRPHENFEGYLLEYLPPAFKSYLDSCQGSKVHLIGGGYGECVHLTKQILDLVNIPNCIHAKYCYEINPNSSLSYPPLECRLQEFSDQFGEIINHQTREINWSFIRNDFLYFD
ncbi:MAG: hypothetical protein ACRKFN_11040 [Desulfitobacterium sp.]